MNLIKFTDTNFSYILVSIKIIHMKKITYLIISLILVSFTNSTNIISNLEFIADLDNLVYVADNGITIKAKEWAKIGAT